MWVNQLIGQLTKTFQHERQGQDCTKKTELAKQKPYSHSLVSIILDPCAEFLNGIRSSFEMFQHVNPCHLISCSQVYEFKKGGVAPAALYTPDFQSNTLFLSSRVLIVPVSGWSDVNPKDYC